MRKDLRRWHERALAQLRRVSPQAHTRVLLWVACALGVAVAALAFDKVMG